MDCTVCGVFDGEYCVVGLFGLHCVCWVPLDSNLCGGFVWTVLCVVGLFGLYCLWWVILDSTMCVVHLFGLY